jgi:hypothetical protein
MLAQLVEAENLVTYNTQLSSDAKKFILVALSKSSWAKYCFAWNAFKNLKNLCRKIFSDHYKKRLSEFLLHGAL